MNGLGLISTQNTSKPATILVYNTIQMDIATHTVWLHNQPVHLSPTQCNLLLLLLTHQGRTFTRSELLAQVWGIDIPLHTRTVDVHIGFLRRKLGLEKDIVTVPHTGYRLNYLL